MIDEGIILEVTRNLIGETEPYGDSAIDRERTENVDKLIYVIDELLYDLEKVAVNKDRHEGSMRDMGKKAHKAIENFWSWINAYLADDEVEHDGLLRKFGYISEKNLIDVAMEVYERNDTAKASDEKDFCFKSGNANAVGYILGRLGFDVTSLVRTKMEV